MAGLPREQVAGDGVTEILKILNQKYGVDVEKEKIKCLDEFFRVERGRDERVQDYVSRFDLMSRKCMAIGMEDMREEYKGVLLMTRAHLEDRQKYTAGRTDGEVSYPKVKSAEPIQRTGEERNKDVGQKPDCQMLLMPQEGTHQS